MTLAEDTSTIHPDMQMDRNLLVSILEQSILYFKNALSTLSKSGVKTKKFKVACNQALMEDDFLKSDEEEYVYSFGYICTQLGWDIKRTRKGIYNLLSSNQREAIEYLRREQQNRLLSQLDSILNCKIKGISLRPKTQPLKWTKEKLLEEIVNAFENDEDLRTGSVQRGKLRNLCAANRYHGYFLSWDEAVTAAGFSLKDIRAEIVEKGRKERRILLSQDLVEANRQGIDLSAQSLQRGKTYRSLYDRAKSLYFGRLFWENALGVAGLDIDKIVKRKNWIRDKVEREIRRRENNELALNSKAVFDADSSLWGAAKRRFGSWDNALKYCGFDPKSIRLRQKRSDSELIKLIKNYEREGIDLNEKRLLKGDDQNLKRISWVAKRRFGSWDSALKKAGIDYSKYRQVTPPNTWNEDLVIERINELNDKNEPLNIECVRRNYSDLYSAAMRNYGSWKKAIEFSGLDYSKIRVYESHSLDSLIADVRNLEIEGADLNSTSVGNNPQIRKIKAAIFRRGFDSWYDFLDEAGIDSNKYRKNKKN